MRSLHEYSSSFLKLTSVQILSDDQILVRHHFSMSMLLNYPDFLSHIFFSDESRFCNNPDNSKHSISTIAWGAIGYNYKSPLYSHYGGVDNFAYMKCLEDADLFELFDSKFGKGCYIFQQDGTTCHTAKETIAYLKSKARVLHG